MLQIQIFFIIQIYEISFHFESNSTRQGEILTSAFMTCAIMIRWVEFDSEENRNS